MEVFQLVRLLLRAGEAARFGIPSFDGREASFVVRDALPEDAGAYTCLAENEAGKTSCGAAVFVRGEGVSSKITIIVQSTKT